MGNAFLRIKKYESAGGGDFSYLAKGRNIA